MPRTPEKGLRGSGAGTLGVPLEGTRRVGGLLGVAGRLSGTVSPFRAEQGTSTLTPYKGAACLPHRPPPKGMSKETCCLCLRPHTAARVPVKPCLNFLSVKAHLTLLQAVFLASPPLLLSTSLLLSFQLGLHTHHPPPPLPTLGMSDSVRPQRQQPARLPHPWDSPGKNTGVGCHFLLQCTQERTGESGAFGLWPHPRGSSRISS